MGSTRLARPAGTYDASSAVSATVTATPARVAGSRVCIWESCTCATRAAHQAPASSSPGSEENALLQSCELTPASPTFRYAHYIDNLPCALDCQVLN